MHLCITKDIEWFLKGKTRYLNNKTEGFFLRVLKGDFKKSAEISMFLLQVGETEKALKEKGLYKENPQLSHLSTPKVLYADISMYANLAFLMGTDMSSIIMNKEEGTCLILDISHENLSYGECFPLTDWLQALKYNDLLTSAELVSTLDALEGERYFLLKTDSDKGVSHTINWHRV